MRRWWHLDEYLDYTTVQGDTFDIISLGVYDDEFKAHLIMAANPDYVHTIIFRAGIHLRIPIIEEDAPSTLPPWKR
jgi:hypothetical protein